MENNQFLLRKPIKSDVADLLAVKNNKNTAKLLGGDTPDYSSMDIINWIDYHNNCKDEELFIIYDKYNDIVIGHIGLYKIDNKVKSAEFAILIGNDAYIGKGVGSQVTALMLEFGFNKLLLNRISLSLLHENIPAYKLYKKIGFVKEGCLRESVWKNERYFDNVLMAILKKDYENK